MASHLGEFDVPEIGAVHSANTRPTRACVCKNNNLGHREIKILARRAPKVIMQFGSRGFASHT